MCHLRVAATTTGIRSEHVAAENAAASNMYAMCGINEPLILKIQAVSFLYNVLDVFDSRSDLLHEHVHNRGLGLRRETGTLWQLQFDHSFSYSP